MRRGIEMGFARWRHQHWEHSGDQHHSRNDVQRSAVRATRLAHVSDQERSERAGKTPGGQHEAVDWAYVFGAEIIGRKRRHGSESASVTEQDDEGDHSKHARRSNARQEPEEQRLHQEHHKKCRFPRDDVRSPSPKHSPQGVAETDHSDHACGHNRTHARQFLEERRFLRNHRNARGGVQKKEEPQRPPLPTGECFRKGIIPLRPLGRLRCCGAPALGPPALRRVLHESAGNNRHNQEGNAKVGERLEDTNGLDQPRRQGRGDQRAGAEAADGDAGDQSSAIREPLDQHSDRHDVAEAQADSANHTITHIQPPQPMTGEASQEDSNSIQDATGQCDDAWATTIQPEATEESRNPQCEDADGKR